jgi:hypothetical protein
MTHLNLIATFFLTTCASISVFAQADTSLINDTDYYVKYIDSIQRSDNLNHNGFRSFIEDGVIQKDGETIGGYGTYTLTNSKNDSVYRIEYIGGLNVTVNKTYYYKADKLIFARLQLISNKKAFGNIYTKTEYYSEGETVKSDIQKEKIARNYSTEINFSLFQDGIKFLDNFKREYNRR